MRRRLRLGSRSIAFIAALLFVGTSLLFSGCKDDDQDICVCVFDYPPPQPGHFWQVQLESCDAMGHIQVSVITLTRYDYAQGTVEFGRLRFCQRVYRVTEAACTSRIPHCTDF